MDLVLYRVLHEAFVTGRVEVICPDPDVLFRCGQGEWSNASHDVADGFSLFEFGD